jgi:hypothetical protein
VLASGDYSGGEKVKSMFWPEAASVDAINVTNTGDGHLMGMAAGGIILNGEVMTPNLRFGAPTRESLLRQLPPARALTALMQLSLEILPLSLLRPFILSFMTTYLAPERSLFRAGAILVNYAGERFVDEIAEVELAIPKQPGKSAFILFDDAIARQFSAWPNFVSTAPAVGYAYVQDYRRVRKDLYRRAATLDALAQSLGIPADALGRTVAAYNGQNGKRARLMQPPFHALGPVGGYIVLTDGGLAVSARHEVLRGDGGAIPGLFAAGSAGQGGLILNGHGHHLAWAFTSGRRAGSNAAQA